jgi:uncharacterized protein (DUF934 family)
MLIRNGVGANDPFVDVADDAPLPDGAVIVSLTRFRADREAVLARNTPVGVRLTSEQSPEALGSDLDRLALVVLQVGKFRDGRVFSWARLLRTRLKFAGEVRVTGNFLYDQIAFLARVGVNAFVLPPSLTPELFARALSEMTDVYQPSADGKETIGELRE